MKHTKGKFIAKAIVFGLVAGVAFTFGVMLLWNWLMPMIFGLTVLTFWQALGVLVLAKILFGGGGHGHKSFNKHNKEKFWREKFHEKIELAKAQKIRVAENE